jgi:hypothetical protein
MRLISPPQSSAGNDRRAPVAATYHNRLFRNDVAATHHDKMIGTGSRLNPSEA